MIHHPSRQDTNHPRPGFSQGNDEFISMKSEMSTRAFPPAILFVDDEEMARKYFARLFGTDRPVLTAAGMDEALAMLRITENRIGIIITDYRMPGNSGGELLRRAAAEFPQVVRILLTAYADRDVLLETVNTGDVFRIVEKPLDNDRLEQVLRQAEELLSLREARRMRLQAVDEAVAFLAHELNTPLAAIVNYSNGIQQRLSTDDPAPSGQTELLKAAEAVDNSARYCMDIISSFVESTRSAGALRPAHGESTARQLLLSLLDAYPLSPAQRGWIHLEVEKDFQISALPNCVSLVLSTLLGNALRALADQPAPSIVFKVSGGKTSFISVSDNGTGIPNDVMETLFQDPVTLHADSGSKGMGLIFCKRVMQAFNGDISVQSLQGVSTTVTLSFPPAHRRANPQ